MVVTAGTSSSAAFAVELSDPYHPRRAPCRSVRGPLVSNRTEMATSFWWMAAPSQPVGLDAKSTVPNV